MVLERVSICEEGSQEGGWSPALPIAWPTVQRDDGTTHPPHRRALGVEATLVLEKEAAYQIPPLECPFCCC